MKEGSQQPDQRNSVTLFSGVQHFPLYLILLAFVGFFLSLAIPPLFHLMCQITPTCPCRCRPASASHSIPNILAANIGSRTLPYALHHPIILTVTGSPSRLVCPRRDCPPAASVALVCHAPQLEMMVPALGCLASVPFPHPSPGHSSPGHTHRHTAE